MARLAPLLAIAGLGSAATLLGGRAILSGLPPLNPGSPAWLLPALQRWAPDPALRRDASLLLAGRLGGDPAGQHRLLQAQGWGLDPLAAVVLKRDAQALTALGEAGAAERRWRQLLQRFPTAAASADALYVLGRRQPQLRRQLLHRFPAHPAALAAAQEAADPAAALHLARWGVRWPGAEARVRQRCAADSPPLPPAHRDQLARALAQLGDGEAGLACLQEVPPSAATQLAIGRSLIGRPGEAEQRGETMLLQLALRHPATAEAREAVELLSESSTASSLAALNRLPPALQQSAPVAARRALSSEGTAATLAVLHRWPQDPASWELQWQQARLALLQGRWQEAISLLAEPRSAAQQPPLLDSRRLFWLGFSHGQQGQRHKATELWRDLLQRHPGGYYGWRATARLGREAMDPARPAETRSRLWQPLGSGDAELDRLWRLDQPLEAWEQWRHHRGGQPPTAAEDLLVEGRLRRAVGDHWMGLAQLEQASLRLPARACAEAAVLERALHEKAQQPALERASRQTGVSTDLLAAVAKQESRFTPGVHSAAGAVGLLQLMPETAAELAGRPVPASELEDPDRNAVLGARYLDQLQRQWRGNPLLVAASYNAGPGAVAGWISPLFERAPELWVEAIPYPETRLYVKKVTGNLWSLQEPRLPRCPG